MQTIQQVDDWVLQNRAKLAQEIHRIAEERDRHILGCRQADKEEDLTLASGVMTDLQALALTNSELVCVFVCVMIASGVMTDLQALALTNSELVCMFVVYVRLLRV